MVLIPRDKKPELPGRLDDDKNGLSGGAIAGIVIGVIIGLAVVGSLAAWWWQLKRRRKSARYEGVVAEKRVDTLEEASDDLKSMQSPDTAVSELPPDWLKPELSDENYTLTYELPSGQDHGKEGSSDGENGGSAIESKDSPPEESGAKEVVGDEKNDKPAAELEGSSPVQDERKGVE